MGLAGGRGRQPPPPRRLRGSRRRPSAVFDGDVPGRGLPALAQAVLNLVPEGKRGGTGHPGGRPHDRDGGAASRQRARRSRMADGDLGDLGPHRRRRAHRRLPRPRGTPSLSPGALRPLPGGPGVLQPGAPPRQPRLFRPHVGALRYVDVVLPVFLRSRAGRPGGISGLRHVRSHRHRGPGLLGGRSIGRPLGPDSDDLGDDGDLGRVRAGHRLGRGWRRCGSSCLWG